MTDFTRPARHKKRLSVRFGVGDVNRVAFTEDISMNGIFIRSLNVCTPNTKIKLEFVLDDEHKVALEGRVMWAKKVPQNLFHLVKKSGMGVHIVRFLSGEEHFRRYCENMAKIR